MKNGKLKSGIYDNLNDVFNNSSFEFYYFPNYIETRYEKDSVFKIELLPNYLLTAELYQTKEKINTPVYSLNNLKINYRQASSFSSANVCFIDVDFKNDKQIKDFQDQYNKYDKSLTFEENIQNFMVDMSEYGWITANSFKGKGVRIIFVILNYFEGEMIGEVRDSDPFSANDIHKSNVQYANKLMLEKTGVRQNDDSVNSITLTTFTCRKKNAIVNSVYHLKEFKFSNIVLTNQQYKTKPVAEVIAENSSIKSEYDWERLDTINNQDFHYSDILPFLSALEIYKDPDIREKFYHLIKRNYTGKSFKRRILSFNNFIIFLNNLHFNDYNVSMKYCLERFAIFKTKPDNHLTDIFGNKYDKIIEIDDYIEDFNFLVGLTGQTVIIAGTGFGKTTQAVIYLNSLKGIKVFIAPTNVILEQTLHKCDELGIKHQSLYSNSKNQIEISDNDFIITNYNNLERLHGLLNGRICAAVIIDECHKITDYATFDKDNGNRPITLPATKQTIYISATPEHFLIGNKSYNYFCFKKKSSSKRDVSITYFRSKKVMKKMVGEIMKQDKDKINIIYNNNKDENTLFKDYLKENYDLDIELVSADNRGNAYQIIINNSVVQNSIITTSILNDGVNINNKIDNVFLFDNYTQSFFDNYQFSNRFRNSSPNIYILRTISYGEDYEFRDMDLKTYFENTFQDKMTSVTSDLDRINNNNTASGSIDISHYPYIYKNQSKYEINENLIKYDIVSDYKKKVLFSLNDYRYFLSRYFNIVKESYVKDISEVEGRKPMNKAKLKQFVFKFYEDWIIEGEVKTVKLSPEENKLYKKYKGTIETYMKRYQQLNEFKDFDKEVISLRNNEFKSYISKKKMDELRESKEKSKLDSELINDINEVDRIINENNELEYFKEEILKINLLSDNKFDLKTTRSINKGLNVFGYKFIRKTVRVNNELVYEYHAEKCN